MLVRFMAVYKNYMITYSLPIGVDNKRITDDTGNTILYTNYSFTNFFSSIGVLMTITYTIIVILFIFVYYKKEKTWK
jgi:hypothetical protein